MHTMVNTTNDKYLIDAITKEQNRLNLSDRKLSIKMGVTHSLWSQIKSGKKSFGREILAGICRNLPDLKTVVISYLEGNGKNEH